MTQQIINVNRVQERDNYTPMFVTKIKYVDCRDVVIDADSLEEAQQKFNEGDFFSEESYDFYADEEISPLKQTDEYI